MELGRISVIASQDPRVVDLAVVQLAPGRLQLHSRILFWGWGRGRVVLNWRAAPLLIKRPLPLTRAPEPDTPTG